MWLAFAPAQIVPAQQARTVPASYSKSAPVQVRAVAISTDQEGTVLEISSNGSLVPTITKLDGPPRLVIDLPGALPPPGKLPAAQHEVKSVRASQYQQNPPIARLVVDLAQPRNYVWETVANKLLVHLHALQQELIDDTPNDQPEVIAAYTAGEEPVTTSGSGEPAGALLLASDSLPDGSAVTAGERTTILNLARGGQVRVCPGTTISVTNAQAGHDLMLGMSTGSIETHYQLASSSDSIVTPDFRILLQGPGEFHYAVSTDSRGNTCVRTLPGNKASAVVSELMGDGTYQLQPNEQVVFRSGQLAKMDNVVPIDCGCPAQTTPVLRADAGPSQPAAPPAEQVASAKPPQPADESVVLLPTGPVSNSAPTSANPQPTNASSGPALAMNSKPMDIDVQMNEPLVFRATDAVPGPTEEAHRLPAVSARPAPMRVVVLPPKSSTAVGQPSATANQPHGVFGHIRHFFARIFG